MLLDEPVVVLVNTPWVPQSFPGWWLPSAATLSKIAQGWHVKVRAVVVTDDEAGADFWSGHSLWLSVVDRSDDQLECVVEQSSLDHPGYRDGDRVSAGIDQVFDILEFGPDGQPWFNEDRGRSMIGKTILVGLTSISPNGSASEVRQLVGSAEQIDQMGIRLRLEGGDYYDLPPDLRPVDEAMPGEYRLRSTGQVVVDPDFTATWNVRLKDKRSSDRRGFRWRK